MNGYKTYVGIAGVLITALAAQYMGADMTEVQTTSNGVLAAFEKVFAALAMLGVTHKIQKNTDAK